MLLFLDQCWLVLVVLCVAIVKVDELDQILPPYALLELVDSWLSPTTPYLTLGVRQTKLISLLHCRGLNITGSISMLI